MTDITGQKFGNLLAIEFLYYNEKYMDCWKFKCDCGNEKIMPAANVKWGRVRSCGCLLKKNITNLRKTDIKGKKFGRLTSLKPTDKRDAAGSIIWECKCDCGKTAYYSVNALSSGKVQSCGCLYQESRKYCVDYRKDFIDNTSVARLVSAKKVRSNNTSGCTGVSFNKKNGKWEARICFKKKLYFLGSFEEKENAIKARRKAEAIFFDSFLKENIDLLTSKLKEEFEIMLDTKSNN